MRRFVVSELSMSPGLVPGDRLLAFRRLPVRRGSIVFFRHPRREDEFWLVKRVIGLPGETVALRDGDVYVDEEPIADDWSTDPALPDGRWTVPAGHVFVLSDARLRSDADSRRFGPIPIAGSYVAAARYRKARP